MRLSIQLTLSEPAEIFSNIFDDDPQVFCIIVQLVLRKQPKLSIYLSKMILSSLLPIGEAQVKLFPETKEKETREIMVLPLDE